MEDAEDDNTTIDLADKILGICDGVETHKIGAALSLASATFAINVELVSPGSLPIIVARLQKSIETLAENLMDMQREAEAVGIDVRGQALDLITKKRKSKIH